MEFQRQECWGPELPFFSPGESSRPRDQTQVSCVAGRFFLPSKPPDSRWRNTSFPSIWKYIHAGILHQKLVSFLALLFAIILKKCHRNNITSPEVIFRIFCPIFTELHRIFCAIFRTVEVSIPDHRICSSSEFMWLHKSGLCHLSQKLIANGQYHWKHLFSRPWKSLVVESVVSYPEPVILLRKPQMFKATRNPNKYLT